MFAKARWRGSSMLFEFFAKARSDSHPTQSTPFSHHAAQVRGVTGIRENDAFDLVRGESGAHSNCEEADLLVGTGTDQVRPKILLVAFSTVGKYFCCHQKSNSGDSTDAPVTCLLQGYHFLKHGRN